MGIAGLVYPTSCVKSRSRKLLGLMYAYSGISGVQSLLVSVLFWIWISITTTYIHEEANRGPRLAA